VLGLLVCVTIPSSGHSLLPVLPHILPLGVPLY
jgi:hypothetical protein